MMAMSENTDSHRQKRAIKRPDAIATARGTIVHAPPRGPDAAQRDDGTVRTARQNAEAPRLSVRWNLQLRPLAVRRARVLVRYILITWDLEPLADDAELLVSELTTNALLHAAGMVNLHLVIYDRLLCEVGDADHTLPTLHHPLSDGDSGRGLNLVDQLASRWRSTRTQTGKLVWFELHLPTDVSADT
jgi:hypothetical protein